MTRAVFLPTTGDPYIAQIWLESYKRYYSSYVDKLYVNINSGIDQEIMDHTCSLFRQVGAEIITHPGLINHGKALSELLDISFEDHILIVEEDFYMLEDNDIDKWFRRVENSPNLAVVSPRGSADAKLIERVEEKFNVDSSLHLQPHFWPSLCCIHRSKLEQTDKHFDSKDYPPSEYIKELDWTPPVRQCGDTFVWTSIQLRAMQMEFAYYTQWRLCDVLNMGKDFKPPWIHMGSTSQTVNGWLLDDKMVPLGHRKFGGGPYPFPSVPAPGSESHCEQLVAFWLLCYQRFPLQNESCLYFNDLYGKALTKLAAALKLDQSHVFSYMCTFQKYLKDIL